MCACGFVLGEVAFGDAAGSWWRSRVPARSAGFLDVAVVGHAERQAAIAEAEREPRGDVDARFVDQVAAGDAQVDRPFGTEHGDVVGAEERDVDRHVAHAGEQAPLLAAKLEAGFDQAARRRFRPGGPCSECRCGGSCREEEAGVRSQGTNDTTSRVLPRGVLSGRGDGLGDFLSWRFFCALRSWRPIFPPACVRMVCARLSLLNQRRRSGGRVRPRRRTNCNSVAEHHQQVIEQVARLADEMLVAGLARLAGGFDHLGRFFDDLGSDLGDAAGEQLAVYDLSASPASCALADRLFELIERTHSGGRGVRRLPSRARRPHNGGPRMFSNPVV